VIDRIQQAIALHMSNQNVSALREEITACLGDPVGFDPVDLPPTVPDIISSPSSDGSYLCWVDRGDFHPRHPERRFARLQTRAR
jgi:hypothetical protein